MGVSLLVTPSINSANDHKCIQRYCDHFKIIVEHLRVEQELRFTGEGGGGEKAA